jgi:cytochrome c peroxidase
MLFSRKNLTTLAAPAFAVGALVGTVIAIAIAGHSAGAVSPANAKAVAKSATQAKPASLAARKAAFRRPDSVPFPADNPFSEAKRALGEKLFYDPRLSANDKVSCASCHDLAKGFADGAAKGKGVPGRALARHTPTLWNLAWGRAMFWDGRARSLEEQVSFPIQNPEEMAQPLEPLFGKLAAIPDYVTAFAAAFPDDPKIDRTNLMKAIATYERTFVSPVTRFDRWIAGDDKALRANEVRGFNLFTGKAGCANCHSGWTFTDSAFYDIGLPGSDRGRGAVLRLPQVNFAFKTPTLRELTHSAPYMHDGSVKTLEDAVRHYETGIVQRPTLPPELPRKLKLTDKERHDLVAFLQSLSSELTPTVSAAIKPETVAVTTPAAAVDTVSQIDRSFEPGHITIKRGSRLWIVNNDSRTHNVRIFDEKLDFDSGAQEPGEVVDLTFAQPGSYLMSCSIHPKMELHIDVTP